MLVESASFVFKEAGSIKQEEGEVENILASEGTLCCMLSRLWRDGVRGEGEKGVGSIPAIRCKVGKVAKEVGYEIRCIGEEAHMDLWQGRP